ncbi:L-serine ammonia-lyase [Allobranchiibius sp. CTAmp26]|uniref:L-serine ammonia-lyase n=1 Tax=Allobranchiibius sp. CTAmp26 TaxID=2815214 RepID=UPI001AA1A27E|nr:L-serine ammonia-lyase [Allobranchiibius sp. CTAmp26]MBO1754553.1 L-serine ammonia-lyase [Allobranchiibius sp. CTAmp26]
MALSALDLFSVGIGPSSSHTVGPMRAAKLFVDQLVKDGDLERVGAVTVELFGSLAATGVGHGTDRAVLLGLEGCDPESIDVEAASVRVDEIGRSHRLRLGSTHAIDFDPSTDLTMHLKALPRHPNGLRFHARDTSGDVLLESEFYSVGGGFVIQVKDDDLASAAGDDVVVPYPFRTATDLLKACADVGGSIADVMSANEAAFRAASQTRAALLHIWDVMQECVEQGCTREADLLPGRLQVRRRAPRLRLRLREQEALANVEPGNPRDPLWAMEWVNLYALAVNEENASGGRVVTAPTNGAAGIVPAVLHYLTRFVDGADDDSVVTFLLTAAAIGILYKEGASISGAEVGCQGEVGSACSMAAGALCAVLGGSPAQVENAAEIGIEHNLGLTCDPVGGLVQVPCIERNAIASVKAINAARLALQGDGEHRVRLDDAIATMRETGADMKDKYKETSRGGLAVNVIEC